MKLFCSSSTSDRFSEGEYYESEFNGTQFHIEDNLGLTWSALYQDESGFIVIDMVGGDFVELE